MKLKSDADIAQAVGSALTTAGFAAPAAGSDTVDKVKACCAPVEAAFAGVADVGAIPFNVLWPLVLQLIPILFGEGGITWEKIEAVLNVLKQIFG